MLDAKTPSEESLCERINKRDRERRTEVEKRKEEREQLVVKTEKSSYFKDVFNAHCQSIRDMLDRAKSSPAESLPEIFENAKKDINTLKNYWFESKLFLKVYDIRMAQETLISLEEEVNRLKAKLVPRKKFEFKNQNVIKKASDEPKIAKDDIKSPKSVPVSNKQIIANYGENSTIVIGRDGEVIDLDFDEVYRNDVMLSELNKCTVRVCGTPSTLHMVNLNKCTVLIGPVTTSVFIDDCNDCEFALACQQLRLHNSSNCKIYLHVTSRAILEDCTKIMVAPYNWTYDDMTEQFELARLDYETNNWNCVDDFNWLRETPSPNWSILEPELRTKSWDQQP